MNILNDLLPSAGAILRMCCFSMSSKKSVAVNVVSVTPAGIFASSSLQSSALSTLSESLLPFFH